MKRVGLDQLSSEDVRELRAVPVGDELMERIIDALGRNDMPFRRDIGALLLHKLGVKTRIFPPDYHLHSQVSHDELNRSLHEVLRERREHKVRHANGIQHPIPEAFIFGGRAYRKEQVDTYIETIGDEAVSLSHGAAIAARFTDLVRDANEGGHHSWSVLEFYRRGAENYEPGCVGVYAPKAHPLRLSFERIAASSDEVQLLRRAEFPDGSLPPEQEKGYPCIGDPRWQCTGIWIEYGID